MRRSELAAAVVVRRLDRNEIGISGAPPQDAEHGVAYNALTLEGKVFPVAKLA
jgi:hypothetical protein